MAGYIYLPVFTTEMLQFATAWQEGQRGKGKVAYEVLYNKHEKGFRKTVTRAVGGGCLQVVGQQDKLYILLHGAGEADSRFVGATRSGNDSKRYTPAELAQNLKKEGLSTSVTAVKLYACGSGLAGGLPSFAQRLKSAMVGLGYHHVTVTGYLGDLKSSYAPRKTNAFDLSEENHKGVSDANLAGYARASARRVVF